MNILKQGSSGNDVVALQQSLIQLGYPMTADGIFGSGTDSIVRQFQQDHDLTADGIVGPATWTAINSAQPTQSVVGIDVSHHNGAIDWSAVSKDQVGFVFCKASQGSTFKDPNFKNNIAALKAAGFTFGGYHFFTFQGASPEDQVNNFLDGTIDYSQPGTLPPVLDVEWQQGDAANAYITNNKQACIDSIKAWIQLVQERTGRVPMIYTNTNFWHEYLGDVPELAACPLWIASYNAGPPALPTAWNEYTFWQFTEQGSVTGISGQVDKSRFNGTATGLANLSSPIAS
jgi:lysozyme